MKKTNLFISLFLILAALKTQAANLPEPQTIDGFGVNIHAQSYTYKDADMIKNAGFKVIRTDLLWHEIEQKKGVYDFSDFDLLLSELHKRGIRALLILAYGNPDYGCKYNVISSKGMEGYKNFIKAAVSRYKQYNPIWEIWNEPDCGYFWKPQPAYEDYTNLVKQIVPVIRMVDPDATIVAPAVGELKYPYEFLEECFKRGLLDYVDAVSVHPYRDPPPESVIADYTNLRTLIKRYSPYRPNIPIISGEWGTTSAASLGNETEQAKYMQRMYLINLYQKIPVSIWYKWKNDGNSKRKKDDNWGLVEQENSLPKEALRSFKKMTETLKNTEFVKRMNHPDPEIFALLFKNKVTGKYILAAWSSHGQKQITLTDGSVYTITDTPGYIEKDEAPF